MAGSLAHILNDDGTFQPLWQPQWGGKGEALAECHQIIAELLDICVSYVGVDRKYAYGINWTSKGAILKLACDRLGYPVPYSNDGHSVIVPAIQPELHGAGGVYKVVDPDPKEWLIWSNEHEAWWRPNHRGYTCIIEEAGRYSKAEADSIVANANACTPHRRGTKTNEMAVKAPEAS